MRWPGSAASADFRLKTPLPPSSRCVSNVADCECDHFAVVEAPMGRLTRRIWTPPSKSYLHYRDAKFAEQAAAGQRGTSAWQPWQPVETQRPPSQEHTLLSRGSQVRSLPGAPTFAHACQQERELRLASHAKVGAAGELRSACDPRGRPRVERLRLRGASNASARASGGGAGRAIRSQWIQASYGDRSSRRASIRKACDTGVTLRHAC